MELLFPIVLLVIWIVSAAIKRSGSQTGDKSRYNARLQQLVETFQAQQGGTAPASGQPLPSGPGQVVHTAGPGQWTPHRAYPVQSPPQQYPVPAPPGQHHQPQHHQPLHHQPHYSQAPNPRQPTPQRDTDQRARELMESGNMIAAVRLLSDEQDMGILQAQEYARSLVAPQPGAGAVRVAAGQGTAVDVSRGDADNPDGSAASDDGRYGGSAAIDDDGRYGGSAAINGDDDERYLGSAAFAESLFEANEDEESWASGWTEPKPDPADRADLDELWQTVRNPPRPGVPAADQG